MRYRIDLSYVGTHYHGWQSQPNASTVQETLESVFEPQQRMEQELRFLEQEMAETAEDPEALRVNILSGPYSLQDKAKMLKMVDDLNKTLTDKYNVNAIVNDMTAGYVGKDKDTYKKALAANIAGDIADYLGMNNKPPTVEEIQQMDL